MSAVYLVQSDSYENAPVEAAFLDEAEAQAHADYINGAPHSSPEARSYEVVRVPLGKPEIEGSGIWWVSGKVTLPSERRRGFNAVGGREYEHSSSPRGVAPWLMVQRTTIEEAEAEWARVAKELREEWRDRASAREKARKGFREALRELRRTGGRIQ